MEHKKTVVMVAWVLLALVFFGLLAFLLFSTPGLSVNIKQAEAFNRFEIRVSNSSKHAIHSVRVVQYAQQETEIARMDTLNPGEEKRFLIPAQEPLIQIRVLAPFHATAEQSVFLQPKKPFTAAMQSPPEALLGTVFQLVLNVCNFSPENQIQINETHDPAFFGSQTFFRELEIPANECRNAEFSFPPRFSGSTDVFFNIKNTDYNETVRHEIIVRS